MTLRQLDLVDARPRGRRVLPLQARRHPGGRLREPPVRAPGDRSTGASAATSSAPRPTTSTGCDLLAHHFWRSDDEDKKREYLRRAADAAQASYANAAAISYFDRLIPLLEGAPRVAETIRLAQVLQLIGDVVRAVRIATDARERAVELDDAASVARCDHSLAESARRLGRFDEAAVLLESARDAFASAGDDAGLGGRAPGDGHGERAAGRGGDGAGALRREPRDPGAPRRHRPASRRSRTTWASSPSSRVT